PTPGRDRMRVTLTGFALAASVRMIYRVHRQAAHRGAHSAPADRACLAVLAQVVLIVTELTEGGTTVDVHLAHLAGLQAQIRVHALARGVLGRAASAARELPAATGFELNVVDHRANRDMTQRHGIAGLDGRL